ncbi:hypothetical protein HID58_071107 [Brassica napus]|uniref:Uncharacterized protein n=2 Tax=Brassica napus TaxID=3708 RepID=A0ABQ7Z0R7_BRANA|nr:hypothetical protein HID58_071107 [Brassica napus]
MLTIEELSLENQQVEDTDMTQEKPAEEVAQEAQLVEEKHADDDILVTEVGDETQLIEEMVDNTEPVEQVAQVVEEKHGDIQPVEEIIEDTQPVEEMAQAVEPIPEHSKNGDSQSHAIPPQEQAAFTISQEGHHHVDVLLQEGHHLEASSQEFPLITVGDGFSDFELYISEVGSREQMKSELDKYLEESLIPRSPDFEVKKVDNYRSSHGHVTLEALFCAKDWHMLAFTSGNKNMKREPLRYIPSIIPCIFWVSGEIYIYLVSREIEYKPPEKSLIKDELRREILQLVKAMNQVDGKYEAPLEEKEIDTTAFLQKYKKLTLTINEH